VSTGKFGGNSSALLTNLQHDQIQMNVQVKDCGIVTKRNLQNDQIQMNVQVKDCGIVTKRHNHH
jgi:hypothetical protein